MEIDMQGSEDLDLIMHKVRESWRHWRLRRWWYSQRRDASTLRDCIDGEHLITERRMRRLKELWTNPNGHVEAITTGGFNSPAMYYRWRERERKRKRRRLEDGSAQDVDDDDKELYDDEDDDQRLTCCPWCGHKGNLDHIVWTCRHRGYSLRVPRDPTQRRLGWPHDDETDKYCAEVIEHMVRVRRDVLDRAFDRGRRRNNDDA